MTSVPLAPLAHHLRDRTARMLLVAGLLLLIPRLVLILTTDVRQSSDMAWYFERAIELLDTGCYCERGVPTAYWPVGYPAFLAAVFWVFGSSVLAGQLANLALTLVGSALLHRWCLRRFNSAQVAAVAVLLWALYPNSIGYTAGLYSEPLFMVLLLALFVLLDKQPATVPRLMLAGVVAGLATLVKAQTMLLAPLLVLVFTLPPRMSAMGLVHAAMKTGLVTLAMVAVVSPWTMRNWTTLGAPVVVSSNGGMSLLSGNNPSMTTGLGTDYATDERLFALAAFSVEDQVAADARARALARAWIIDNPGRFVLLMPKKFFRLWAVDGESEWVFQAGYPAYEKHRFTFRTLRILNQAIYVVLIGAGLYGIWRLRSKLDPASWAVPGMLIFFSLLCMVFSGQSRYHAPLMPFIMAFAAWVFVQASLRRSRHERS